MRNKICYSLFTTYITCISTNLGIERLEIITSA